jgi:hypothetical protein
MPWADSGQAAHEPRPCIVASSSQAWRPTLGTVYTHIQLLCMALCAKRCLLQPKLSNNNANTDRRASAQDIFETAKSSGLIAVSFYHNLASGTAQLCAM